MVEEGASLEELQEASAKKDEIDRVLRRVEEVTSVDLALANDPNVHHTLFRIENRRGRISKTLLDMAEEFKGGALDTVLETVDQLGYDTYLEVTGFLGLLGGEGTEVSTLSDEWLLALRTYDEDSFDEFVRTRMETISNGGVVGEDPAWRVMRELQALDSAGAVAWDEDAGRVYGALAAVDIATLGVSGAVTGWRAGRSVLGRLRSSAGTEVATEAAVNTDLVVRGGLDGELIDAVPTIEDFSSGATPRKSRIGDDVIDAEFIDDMVPSAAGTKVRPNGKTPPPVSAASVGQAFNENIFVRQFLNRQSRHSFGTADVLQSAEDWAKVEARRMSLASGVRAVDYDVSLAGIGRATVKFSFGKSNGKPFKTFGAAVEHAKSLPNSSIIDSRTGVKVTSPSKSNQYMVQTDINVPLRETVGPTDLSEVTSRTFLGTLFGRADLGSSTFMSNLADFADAGAAGFQKDFQKFIKSSLKLSKGDTQVIDTILTTLRDTPTGGNARTWLTTAEFGDAYRALKGKYPSRDTIKAYETTIQMSDFSWYVMANDRLRILANQKASVVRIGDTDILSFPADRTVKDLKTEAGPVWVWDASRGQRVNVKTLGDNTRILALGHKTKDGSEYVANFGNDTRRPDLEDAFPYNAGGPRSNAEITWFVGNNDSNWSTLIGARSQRDADLAVQEFNTVADAIRRIVGDDETMISYMTKQQRKRIDDLVRVNNKWNPDLEDASDFIEFAQTRGVPANKAVNRRGRGERLGHVITVNDKSLVDMNLETYISFHRHDQALLEYGGAKASNPDPLLAIHRQFNSMVTRGAQTQYRMNHPTAWTKAVDRAVGNGDIPEITITHPMSDEMKVRNIKIEGNSVTARKLRQEQSRINRRLDMFEGSQSATVFDHVGKGASRSSQWAVEELHNLHPRAGVVGSIIKKGGVDNLSNTLLSLGFFQKMADPSQMFLQSAHFIPVVAMSPKNGARATGFASIIRQAARSGDPNAWTALARGIKTLTGISDSDLKALTEHMFDSGRGYMKGSIAEDPSAGLSNSMLGKAKDIVTSPYYAGENFGATVSRVAAFLDIRDKFPSLSTDSREFWNAVQALDRDYSFALNKSQKSVVQSDPITRVATQWTSYQLRLIETVLFNNNLSKKQRGSLAAATTIMWGLGGMGMYQTGAYISNNVGMPSWLSDVVLSGADVAFDNLLGVKVGDRLAFNPIELYERARTNPADTIPAFSIVAETAGSVLTIFQNIGAESWGLLSHDVTTLARAWKLVDNGVMAWGMAMEDVRRTKSGQRLHQDFTPMQVFLQAVGIRPSEAVDLGLNTSLVFDVRKRKDRAINQALPIMRLAVEAGERGEYGKAMQFGRDVDATLKAYNLSSAYLAEARETVFNKVGYDRINWLSLELTKAEFERQALQLQETFK